MSDTSRKGGVGMTIYEKLSLIVSILNLIATLF